MHKCTVSGSGNGKELTTKLTQQNKERGYKEAKKKKKCRFHDSHKTLGIDTDEAKIG
jgi:hypothetical protein